MKRAAFCVFLSLAVAGCGSAHNAGRPLPVKFVSVALSALNSRDFFLLGTLPCSANRCYAIERTVDGGRSFTRLPAPRGLPTEGNSPTLRFADTRNGFIWVPFGWGSFYATHNGGVTWRRLRSPAVVSFTTAGEEAYAVVARCSANACSRYRFARRPVSASRWTESPLPFMPDGPIVDLRARGSDVWLLGTPGGTRFERHDVLARSGNGGRTFTSGAGPCYPGLGGDLEPSSAHVIWAVCPTGMMAAAARSTDGGATFTPLHTPPLVNSAQLAPATDEIAVLAANGPGGPFRTSDGGSTWTPIAASGRDDIWFDVTFTDAHVGVALVQVGARAAVVRRTTDGGANWSPIRQR